MQQHLPVASTATTNNKMPGIFDSTSQAWIWDELLWLPDGN
jgi:hypothetical protein